MLGFSVRRVDCRSVDHVDVGGEPKKELNQDFSFCLSPSLFLFLFDKLQRPSTYCESLNRRNLTAKEWD